MITQDFTINIPNEPYVNNFSEGKTQAAQYKGVKYIRVQYDLSNGEIKNVVGEADDMETLNSIDVPLMEGHAPLVIDATQNPFEASYITGNYSTGDVADYTENLGIQDADGNDISWTYYYQDGKGCISQLYNVQTLKWVNNAFVAPEFRVHALTKESFDASVAQHIDTATAELAKEDVYTAEEKTAITAYKTFLESISTTYAGISHWKINFPSQPEYR
jgi:hypothetical protein